MNNDSEFRCGLVAVVGRPNVGKSTLVNAIVGRKVSIVTAKPQTTRHRIMAVHNSSRQQTIFVDTPGLHRQAGKAMNRLMNRTASNALADADLIFFVSDATRWTNEDDDVLLRLKSARAPVIAVLNKVDKISPKERLLGCIADISSRFDFQAIVPTSALKNDNLDVLLGLIREHLPLSPPLFPEGASTDRSPAFHAAETVREKLTEMLHKELPYGLTVQIERYERGSKNASINAIIWVERVSQKGIVVGKSGGVLKKVGRAARLDIAADLGVPVHLELWVKVKSNWADNEHDLMSLGYEAPK